jgi:prespore-specific regulator
LRQDAWSTENDVLLAETILRHVREDSTQLKAFDEVGDKLNRTAGACGFRWNAVLRQQYERALDLAKRQRKEHNRLLLNQKKKVLLMSGPTDEGMVKLADQVKTPFSMNEVIKYLRSLDDTNQLKNENEQLLQEIETLNNEKLKLERKIEQLEQSNGEMQEDYETLMEIMNRARKLVLFDEDEVSQAIDL